MKPLSCSEGRLFLSDLLAHALAPEDQQRLGTHLADCADCQQLGVKLFRQDRFLVQVLAAGRVEHLAGRIRKALGPPPAGCTRRLSRRLAWCAGGLAASILVVAAVILLKPAPAEEVPAVRLDSKGEGEVFLVDGQVRSPFRSGQALAAGQALQTVGNDSRAVLTYQDATELVLGENSTLQLVAGSPAATRQKAVPGKRIFLREGVLTADVSRQPADQPLVLTTPHAEVVVLGTRFWVGTTQETTRIEVEEGAAQFHNKASAQAVSLRAGDQAVAASATGADGGSPWVESFDAIERFQVLRGYRSRNARLELLPGDRKEGQASVRVSWTSSPAGYGTGGIEKTFAPADFTGKSFTIWLKPLTPVTCQTLAVALYDNRGLRAEVRFIHLTSSDWVHLPLAVGEKGRWSVLHRYPEADLTRISRIEFYGITRGANQTAAILVDGFEETKGK